jgi:diguanylate cyclase (GGDEF)-like protein
MRNITRNELTSEGAGSLSTGFAGRHEVRLALTAVLISFAIFCAAAPFSTMPLAQVPAVIPAYESALVLCDLITAVLLFGQFNVFRSRALFVLASGYLFTAFIAFSHALTFLDVFSPTGLLGAGPQSTAWLYMFWHGGFPLFVILFALLKDDDLRTTGIRGPGGRSRSGAGFAVLGGIAAIVVVVCGLTLVATTNRNYLPTLLVNNRFTPMTVVVSAFWALSLLALIVLCRRRPYKTLDLWLMVIMCAWLFGMALSAVLNAARFDLGWYVGRIYGLLAASSLLIVLLIETGTHYARVAALSAALSAMNTSLERLFLHDALTDVANRRFFDTYLANQIAVARRHKRTLALVLCDVDAFKAYNDHYGHQAGDACLKQVATALQSCCRRPADMVARYGGEEFAIILPETDLIGATQIAEAAGHAVSQLKVPHTRSATAPYVSISGDVAILLQDIDFTAQKLIEAADQSLYRAKHLGRNRMECVHVEAA